MAPREDVQSARTSRRGLAGSFEGLLRRFRTLMHVALFLPLLAAGAACFGLALAPALALYDVVTTRAAAWSAPARYLAQGMALGTGWFVFGFALLLVLPAANWLLRIRLREWRGQYYSLESVPWFIHNGATYLMRYTFLEFITPSPFNTLFYRLMGMKIGRGTVINSSAISDPQLIELGKRVTIGGSVTIVGHYGQAGFLVLAPVKIGDGATIGLRATIMGGVRIGENAKILPNSVVLPKTVIPAGETWGGVPATKFTAAKPRKPTGGSDGGSPETQSRLKAV